MENSILDTILSKLYKAKDAPAFYINEQFYTYTELSHKVAGISATLKELPPQTPIGIVTTNSIETYASILALWFNAHIFIPISPANAKERNKKSIAQAAIQHILTPTKEAAEIVDVQNITLTITQSLSSELKIENKNKNADNILYLLFTSGSTGTPKGVPINLKNLNSFVDAFYSIGYPINEQDRFLQIFDFTFDVSVQSYVLPLVKGACIYTVPQTEIKFMAALKILKEQRITFAKLVPSTLNYFKPYFDRINLPHLKYSLFSGEALPYNIAKAWSKCVPNASIENHYGPTEATIDCLSYKMNTAKAESHQGIMSIGKPFEAIDAQIIDGNNNFICSEEQGELVISGNQVTKGYLNNPLKNKTSFLVINNKTYYKTGDIVFKNDAGNYFYCGRKDSQLQVQGYRVELGEIEFQIKKIIPNKSIVVSSHTQSGILFIVLFIEGKQDFENEDFERKLKKTLPHYMLPKMINFVGSFPLTVSGKIDVNALKKDL